MRFVILLQEKKLLYQNIVIKVKPKFKFSNNTAQEGNSLGFFNIANNLQPAQNILIIIKQHRRMLIKTKTFFRRQTKNRQISLQSLQVRANLVHPDDSHKRQSISNSEVHDFLKIDSLNKRRNKSVFNIQKNSKKDGNVEERQLNKCNPIIKRPSVNKQAMLPLKINKLIINNLQLRKVQKKNAQNQNIETPICKNRLSFSQISQDNIFPNLQIFQQTQYQQKSKMRNNSGLREKQNVFYQNMNFSAQKRRSKRSYTLAIKIDKQYKRERLAFKRKEVDFHFQTCQGQNYSRKMEEVQANIQILQNKQMMLEVALKSFQKVYREIQIQHKIKTEELGQYQKKLSYVITSLDSKSKELVSICQLIEENSKKLASIEQKGIQIQNFVNNQQKRKILHQVSQDYKKKEGDMYDYALQMQTNTWATGLKELKPFTQQEKYLEQRMSSLYRELSNDKQAISFEKKCNEIKDFVFKMYASFKRMNDDMRTINDFKTKCIREFVERMQKWLQNWQLKQQFLVNLRQQFALNEVKLNQDIQSLQNSLILQGSSHSQAEKFKQIKLGIQKLTQNYKLGNSFY